MKKITHVVKTPDNADPFGGSGIGVYGKADLARVKAQAKAAGVRITITEATPEED